MLLTRVLSALVLAPIVVWLTWQGGNAFLALILVAAAIAAWEFCTIAIGNDARALTSADAGTSTGTSTRGAEPLLRIGVIVFAVIAAYLVGRGPDQLSALLGFKLQFHARDVAPAAALAIFALRVIRPGVELPEAVRQAGLGIAGVVYAGMLPAYLVRLRDLPDGMWWVIVAFAATWLNDTAAYFAGRAFGRRKLHPRVSPAKSWEGAFGGFFGTLAAVLALRAYALPDLGLARALVIAAGASVLGPLGDLTESLMKRASGVKDSGRIIPGHGGLLDRIDALLFVAPWVYWVATWGSP